MKQRFWNQLQSRLCPRQRWTPDQSKTLCQCCGAPFTLFRRRHHCRFCGKLFCSSCSNLYINGTYLGLRQKYVRHCEFCLEQINRIKRDLTRLAYMVQQQGGLFGQQDDEEGSGSSSDQDREYMTFKVVFGSLVKEEIQVYGEELQGQIRQLVAELMDKAVSIGVLSPQFSKTRLVDIIQKAVLATKMQILPLDLMLWGNYMDIAKYVQIVTVQAPPGKVLQLIQGVVIRKDLAIKRMLTYLHRPQLIIIQNSLDQTSTRLKFEQLIHTDNHILTYLQQNIMQFNPDIVVVQKTINRQILDYFNSKGLVVISGVNRKQLQDIARVSCIRSTIKNIWKIGRNRQNNIVGGLDKMEVRHVGSKKQPMICLERNIGIYSIVVGEQTQDKRKGLREGLEFVMRVIRMVNLEKYLLYVDYVMWEGRGLDWRIRGLNSDYSNIIREFKLKQIDYVKVQLSQISLSNCQKKLREYCSLKNLPILLSQCGQLSTSSCIFYLSSDLSIGHFLLSTATNHLRKCPTCHLSHTTRYYFTQRGVQIWMQQVGKNKTGNEEQAQGRDVTIERMRKFLKRYKETSDIWTYFQCSKCGKIVSKQQKIGKNYLKNSFMYFLYLISHTHYNKDKDIYNNQLMAGQTSLPLRIGNSNSSDCPHQQHYRIIKTSDVRLKLKPFDIKIYDLNLINLKSQDSLMLASFNLKKHICEQAQLLLISRTQLSSTLCGRTKMYVHLLLALRRDSSSQASKMLGMLQKIQSIWQILQQIQSYLFQLRQKRKNQSVQQDWTFFLRQIYKIDYVIKITVEILTKLQRKLQKTNININTPAFQIVLQPENQTETKLESNTQLNRQFPSGEFYDQYLSILAQQGEMDTGYDERIPDTIAECANMQGPGIYKTNQRYRFLYNQFSQGQLQSQVQVSDDLTYKTSDFVPEEKQKQKQRNMPKYKQRQLSTTSNPLTVKSKTSLQLFPLTQPDLAMFLQRVQHRRYPLKRGKYLYFTCIDYKQPVSVLASALNSPEYHQNYPRKQTQCFRFNLIVSKEVPTSWPPKQKIHKLNMEYQLNQQQKQNRQSYQISTYFPHQFQQLRTIQGLGSKQYILSLSTCQYFQASGGKSGAKFAKSKDGLLVVKHIKQYEFQVFIKFAKQYIEHIKEGTGRGEGSVLAKIYGLYQVTIRGSSQRIIVMQNILFGLDEEETTIYDLKGSQLNRLVSPQPQKKLIGQDTNFKLDRSFHPYHLLSSICSYMLQMLARDIQFLQKQEVIDYSLLVVQGELGLRMGVIDFMRPYHFKQFIERKLKELKYGADPTVVAPQEYADRFMGAMKNYFVGVGPALTKQK